jgi:hypothetical protein
MDDNHFLIEWLAYHYHVLPLRKLVLAVDPRSVTSPADVLARWGSLMSIELWRDRSFMSAQEQEAAEAHVRRQFRKTGISSQPHLIQHRARQRLFYFKCLQRLKLEGCGWVALIDSDEFLHVNYPTVRALNLTAPPMEEEGSVMKFLRQELQRPGHNLSSPCVQIPRLRYGAQESRAEQIGRLVPSVTAPDVDAAATATESPPHQWNASHFQTLRWRKHAKTTNHVQNKVSKTLLDLGRIPLSMIEQVDSIHRPIRKLCGHRRLYIRSQDQVFAINHYLGTWEQYSYRNDSRSGRERSLVVRFEELCSFARPARLLQSISPSPPF